MNRLQALAAFTLFESKAFDTADIAELLMASEAEISRVLTAGRSLVIEFYHAQSVRTEVSSRLNERTRDGVPE